MSTVSKKQNLFFMCFCAVMIALGTVLSLVKLFEMPLGGSVTIASMLPVMLISYFCGVRWGMVSSVIFAAIQLFISLGEVMSWGLSTQAIIGTALLDYILAYSVLGIAGIFRKKDATTKQHLIRFALGMLLAVVLRFVFHFFSGIIIFDIWATFKPAWLYSICYNGGFLLPDLAICVVVGLLIFTPVRSLFEKYAK